MALLQWVLMSLASAEVAYETATNISKIGTSTYSNVDTLVVDDDGLYHFLILASGSSLNASEEHDLQLFIRSTADLNAEEELGGVAFVGKRRGVSARLDASFQGIAAVTFQHDDQWQLGFFNATMQLVQVAIDVDSARGVALVGLGAALVVDDERFAVSHFDTGDDVLEKSWEVGFSDDDAEWDEINDIACLALRDGSFSLFISGRVGDSLAVVAVRGDSSSARLQELETIEATKADHPQVLLRRPSGNMGWEITEVLLGDRDSYVRINPDDDDGGDVIYQTEDAKLLDKVAYDRSRDSLFSAGDTLLAAHDPDEPTMFDWVTDYSHFFDEPADVVHVMALSGTIYTIARVERIVPNTTTTQQLVISWYVVAFAETPERDAYVAYAPTPYPSPMPSLSPAPSAPSIGPTLVPAPVPTPVFPPTLAPTNDRLAPTLNPTTTLLPTTSSAPTLLPTKEIQGVNCDKYAQPLRLVFPSYSLQELDVQTGEYDALLDLEFPVEQSLDAIGMKTTTTQGTNHILYGAVGDVLCPFDNNRAACVGGVRQLEVAPDSGTVHLNSYYYAKALGGDEDASVYVARVDGTNAATSQQQHLAVRGGLVSGAVLDLAAFVEVRDESIRDGVADATYLVGLGPSFEVLLVRIASDETPESYAVLAPHLEWNDHHHQSSAAAVTEAIGGFGGAFAYGSEEEEEPRLFFAADGGLGLFELATPVVAPNECWNTGLDTTNHRDCPEGVAYLVWRAPADAKIGDGFNCPTATFYESFDAFVPPPTTRPSSAPPSRIRFADTAAPTIDVASYYYNRSCGSEEHEFAVDAAPTVVFTSYSIEDKRLLGVLSPLVDGELCLSDGCYVIHGDGVTAFIDGGGDTSVFSCGVAAPLSCEFIFCVADGVIQSHPTTQAPSAAAPSRSPSAAFIQALVATQLALNLGCDATEWEAALADALVTTVPVLTRALVSMARRQLQSNKTVTVVAVEAAALVPFDDENSVRRLVVDQLIEAIESGILGEALPNMTFAVVVNDSLELVNAQTTVSVVLAFPSPDPTRAVSVSDGDDDDDDARGSKNKSSDEPPVTTIIFIVFIAIFTCTAAVYCHHQRVKNESEANRVKRWRALQDNFGGEMMSTQICDDDVDESINPNERAQRALRTAEPRRPAESVDRAIHPYEQDNCYQNPANRNRRLPFFRPQSPQGYELADRCERKQPYPEDEDPADAPPNALNAVRNDEERDVDHQSILV